MLAWCGWGSDTSSRYMFITSCSLVFSFMIGYERTGSSFFSHWFLSWLMCWKILKVWWSVVSRLCLMPSIFCTGVAFLRIVSYWDIFGVGVLFSLVWLDTSQASKSCTLLILFCLNIFWLIFIYNLGLIRGFYTKIYTDFHWICNLT